MVPHQEFKEQSCLESRAVSQSERLERLSPGLRWCETRQAGRRGSDLKYSFQRADGVGIVRGLHLAKVSEKHGRVTCDQTMTRRNNKVSTMLPFGCLPHFSAWGGENSWMTKVGLVRRGHGRRGRSRPRRWDPPIKWFGVGYELSQLNSLFDTGMSIVGLWLQPSESSLQLVPWCLFIHEGLLLECAGCEPALQLTSSAWNAIEWTGNSWNGR